VSDVEKIDAGDEPRPAPGGEAPARSGRSFVLSEEEATAFVDHLRAQQSILRGAAGGAAAAVLAVLLWSVAALLAGLPLLWLMVGAGVVTGCAVRFFGRGIDALFGLLGAAVALAASAGGGFLVLALLAAQQRSLSVGDLWERLALADVWKLATAHLTLFGGRLPPLLPAGDRGRPRALHEAGDPVLREAPRRGVRRCPPVRVRLHRARAQPRGGAVRRARRATAHPHARRTVRLTVSRACLPCARGRPWDSASRRGRRSPSGPP
jgi:hypothetical protein